MPNISRVRWKKVFAAGLLYVTLVSLVLSNPSFVMPASGASAVDDKLDGDAHWRWYRLSVENSSRIVVDVTSTHSGNFSVAVLVSGGVLPNFKIAETPYLAIDTLNQSHAVHLEYTLGDATQYLYLLVISLSDDNPVPLPYTIQSSVPCESYSYAQYDDDVLAPQRRPLIIGVFTLVIGAGLLVTFLLVQRRVREKRFLRNQAAS
ncbi:MAG: hypothetical protein ACTSU5_04405 [Promethearchaeota archaeon]